MSISRRGFLGMGLAAGFSPLAGAHENILPWTATLLGQTSANERLTMGVIGVGGMGSYGLGVFMTQPEVQVVAVADIDAQHLERGKAKVDAYYENTDGAAYADFRDLLTRDDIDAVLIATPDHAHAFLSIAAAQCGKHVYCEKPMSLTVREGRQVVDAMKKLGKVYQSGTQRRSVPCFRYAVETARSGKLGTIHTVHTYLEKGHESGKQAEQPVPEGFNYDWWLGQAPNAPYTAMRCHGNFRWIYDYSGGQLTDIGVHFNDLAQWGLGKDLSAPISFEGTARFPEPGLFDTPIDFHLSCKYADGVKLEMHDGTPRAVKFEGEEGWIMVDDSGTLTGEPASLLADLPFPIESYLALSYHQRNFLDSIAGKTTPIAPPEIAHRSASICHLANLCLRTGAPFTWDPDTEILTGNDAAAKMLGRAQRAPWDLDSWDGESALIGRLG